MTRIGLLSDTHNYLDESIFTHFKGCNEIWHAGDFGNIELAKRLAMHKGIVVRGVSGNIDGPDIKNIYPEKIHFSCEDVHVFMQHIGGYPKRYAGGIKKELIKNNVQLFISGHSHILKIIFDSELNCLHMNPGAAGKQGWHTVRTILRFSIEKKKSGIVK